ncbi:MAG: autotransporter-associated beta strand repeat-containing protein [Bacteroidales bacterium]|nr:autotransporter-associated beta strand repeat-containing protein [Bacteroidales bacterium]
MKKKYLFTLLMLCAGVSVQAQRPMEVLDRGLVAVKVSGGVYTSWRIPGEEYYGVSYNLYRDGTLIAEGLNVSNYVDSEGTAANTYTVAPVTSSGVGAQCDAVSVWSQQYKQIALGAVINPTTGRDVTSVMQITDASVADLDGDGAYELIIERQNTDFTVGNDSAYTRFEAYKMDGTRLWSVNLGPNMKDGNGSENACFAFDFDLDGKAEVVFRGADGTILPDGTVLGDATVNYRTDYTGSQAYMEYGDEFLVLLDGVTGNTLDYEIFDSECGSYNTSTTNSGNPASGVYEPGTSAPGNNLARRSYSFWYGGNSKSDGGHRATKFHWGAPYLDGVHPSIYLGRGCYTNFHAATWDVVNKKLKLRWACAVDDATSEFYGQGYHNFSIVDFDGDGRDEICHGNMTVDEYGKFHSSTGLGHGDAQHYGDLDPYRDGVEGFRCLEDNPGCVYVDANTNEILFRWTRGTDCGRCLAGNFTNDFPGAQLWTVDGNLWSATTSRAAEDVVATSAPGLCMNYRIYWDGDELDECFDGVSTSNYQVYDAKITKYGGTQLLATSGCLCINSTKANPCIQADILGDWREEFIVPTTDNKSVRLYTTVIPTTLRNYTLMHDPQYRQAVYWQASGYNQPPHVSYFWGSREGFMLPPPPVVTNGKTLITTSLTSAQDGQFVLAGQTSATTVTVSGTVAPSYLQVNSPADYTLQGGTLSGSTTLLKQGQGALTLTGGAYQHTGATEVWYGQLNIEADYTTSPIAMKRFSSLQSSHALGHVEMEYGAQLYPASAAAVGTLSAAYLEMDGGAIVNFDMSADGTSYDVLTVGTLVLGAANCIGATPVFCINRLSDDNIVAGEYTLVHVNNVLDGDVSAITIDGLQGQSFSVKQSGSDIVLVVNAMRAPAQITYSGTGDWDLNQTESFLLNGEAVSFVSGDTVTIDASTSALSINVAEDVEPAQLIITGSKKVTLTGSGRVGGACQFIKRGTGDLNIQNVNNFTGGARIEEGRVLVSTMASAQADGPLGAFDGTECKIYIGSGATLYASAALTNGCAIEVGDSACLYCASTWLQTGPLEGNHLVKQGAGNMSFETAPSMKVIEIQAGTYTTMATTVNCLGDTVILRGGTLKFDDSSYTYGNQSTPWVVPADGSASVYLDTRCVHANKLFGSGTVTVYFPSNTSCPRTYLTGDWSAFEGQVNFICLSTSRPVIIDNTYGMPKAAIQVGTAGHSIQIGGDAQSNSGKASGTYVVGALGTWNSDHTQASNFKGTINAGYSSSSAFQIGGTDADIIFAGISNSKLVKKGSGMLTMTANTGSGDIDIQEGSLRVNGGKYTSYNSYTTATGTGTLSLQSGTTMMATGCIGNSGVYIYSGAVFQPGYYYTGTLGMGGVPIMYEGSVIEYRLSKNNTCNTFSGGSNFSNEATIRVVKQSSYVPAAGDRFSLWNTRAYASTNAPKLEIFDLPDSLMWDTDSLNTKLGVLKVVANPNYSGLESIQLPQEQPGIYYNVLGQPVGTPKRGEIYIYEGRKVVWR